MYRSLLDCFRLLIPFTWVDFESNLATLCTIIFVTLNAVGNIYAPRILGNIVENYASIGIHELILLITLLVASWYAQYILEYLQSIVFYVVTNKAIRDIRLRVIIHLHKVSTNNANNYSNAEVINANERVPLAIVNFMNNIFITFVPGIINLISISIALIGLTKLGTVLVLLMILSYIPAYIILLQYIKSRYKVWQTGDRVRIVQTESLQNQISSRMNSTLETERVSKAFYNEAIAWQKNNKDNFNIHIVQELIFFFTSGIITFCAAYLLKMGEMHISAFIGLGGYIFLLHRNMHIITFNLKTLLSSVVDIEKVLKILKLPTQGYNSISPIGNKHEKTDSVFLLDHVSFVHSLGSQPILQNISLSVKVNDKIVIIGPSGAGKSTLCRLIAGIYKPSSGTIKILGYDTNTLSLDAFNSKIKLIGQDCSLIEGTIRDNLYIYGPNIPQEILHYFENRLDEPVGDFGKKLSNGERQRILIARCIAANPEIVILDETFSALEQASGLKLLDIVLDAIPTVVLVTHQKHLLQRFKVIYKLENGFLNNDFKNI